MVMKWASSMRVALMELQLPIHNSSLCLKSLFTLYSWTFQAFAFSSIPTTTIPAACKSCPFLVLQRRMCLLCMAGESGDDDDDWQLLLLLQVLTSPSSMQVGEMNLLTFLEQLRSHTNCSNLPTDQTLAHKGVYLLLQGYMTSAIFLHTYVYYAHDLNHKKIFFNFSAPANRLPWNIHC